MKHHTVIQCDLHSKTVVPLLYICFVCYEPKKKKNSHIFCLEKINQTITLCVSQLMTSLSNVCLAILMMKRCMYQLILKKYKFHFDFSPKLDPGR